MLLPVEATIQVDLYSEQKSAGWGVFYVFGNFCPPGVAIRIRGQALDMFIDAERDDYEENTDLYRKSYDVRVWYRET